MNSLALNVQELVETVDLLNSEVADLKETLATLNEVLLLKDKRIVSLESQARTLHSHWKNRVPFPDIIGNFNP